MSEEEKEVEKFSIEYFTQKVENQSTVVEEISNNIENLTRSLQEQQQSLQLNQGALLQLNLLLDDIRSNENGDKEDLPLDTRIPVIKNDDASDDDVN
tara:strand:+ start:7865 stop:8155 length:291 start_codon:yes stop_codon:yes gene_type:complete